MQKSEKISALEIHEKEVLQNLPETISRTFKKHLEVLMEPFSPPDGLNARIKRVFNKPK